MRMAMLGLIGSGLVLAFIFLAMRMTSPVLSPLYSNLSPDDSAVIATELGAMGVEFEVASSGSQILVKSPDVLRVRMALAQKGLPSKGSIVGYEIFDKDSALGTSNFVLNINMLRALEGELGRTISSMSSIKSARVHLVIPKRELFRKEQIEPTASVVLTLNNRTDMPKNETDSIKHLVSAAVPGLKLSRVTIVDNTGRLLARGASESDGVDGMSPGNTDEYRVNLEERMRKTIENMLEQAVGVGNVNAQVAAEIGFDRVVTNTEEFNPDGAVPRSTQSTSETASSAEGGGGTVGVANNLPDGQAAGAGGGTGSTNEKLDETTNYEISKTVTNKISEIGMVKKLSVAVLVDGKYNVTKDEEGKETRTYVPRTDEELDQLNTLVRTAIGFDEKRGDRVQVTNMQFDDTVDNLTVEEGAFDWLKRDLQGILKTVMVGVVAILAIMLVIRPLVNRAFEISPADLEAEAARAVPAAGGGGGGYSGSLESEEINLDVIQSKLDSTPTRRVNDLMENNPEETLAVIRTWLSEKS